MELVSDVCLRWPVISAAGIVLVVREAHIATGYMATPNSSHLDPRPAVFAKWENRSIISLN